MDRRNFLKMVGAGVATPALFSAARPEPEPVKPEPTKPWCEGEWGFIHGVRFIRSPKTNYPKDKDAGGGYVVSRQTSDQLHKEVDSWLAKRL